MRYGKLTEAGLMQAPNPLRHNGAKTYNPIEALYVAAGFLPVVDTPMPDDGAYYVSHWEEHNGQIVKVWEITDPPVEDKDIVVEPVALTPAQQREAAYNYKPAIEWDGKMLTVTQAAQQWAYYAAEGDTAKTDALTALIAKAKADIRAEWPDNVAAE